MSGSNLGNSPLSNLSYRLHRRLVFLYAALRTRSLFARDELANLATGSGDYQLLLSLESAVTIKNRRAFLDLIWLISNQAIYEHDLKNAIRLYRVALERWGMGRLTHFDRVNLAILSVKLGETDLAEAATNGLHNLYLFAKPFLPSRLQSVFMQSVQEAMHATIMFNRDYSAASEFLKLDIANPFRGLSNIEATELASSEDSNSWLTKLSRELVSKRIPKIEFMPASESWQSAFDLLNAKPSKPVESGLKVTIVISTYRPDETLFTSIKSCLAQSYQNLEILVIDDASGNEFDEVLAKAAALDSRVRVLRQSENGGTYRIRNRALDEATGELITFQDSDDWMHPSRIELQVADLVKHKKTVANISLSTRLTDRLEAIESNRRLRVGICEPALMFRRVQVRDRIGYFDTVRKGGDSEYRKRLMKAFGQDCAVVHPFRILTIQRADNGGLTQGELGYRWIAEFRLIYRDSYLHWLKTAGKLVGFKLAKTETRSFYAPRQMLMGSALASARREFDVVFAVNFRDAQNTAFALPEIRTAIEAGHKVGLLQVNNLYPLKQPSLIAGAAVELLNLGKAEMVFEQDEIVAKQFKLLAPNAWVLGGSHQSFNWQVNSVEAVELAQAAEAFVANGLEVNAAELLREKFRVS